VNYTRNGQPTGIIRPYTCHGDPNQAWDFIAGTSPYGGLACVAQYGSCDRLLEPNGAINWDYGGVPVRFGERNNDYTEWWILERVA
jgi:hypothetical protein